MRTDKDNWDITTSVGSTALFVATARALEAQKPDPLAIDPFAEVFCRAVGGWAADVDLREDWPQALRDSGFDAAKPSAWIAEGLLIYLPAAAEEQLFTGIDALAAPASHVAVEDGAPMASDDYASAVEEERAALNEEAERQRRVFFQLLYNERQAPADQWFGEHGWIAEPTPLADYLREVGRPVPESDVRAAEIVGRNTLVRAVKK